MGGGMTFGVVLLAILFTVWPARGAVIAPADSLRAEELIGRYAAPGGDAGALMAPLALEFIGMPAGEVSGRDSLGRVTLHLDSTDTMGFLNLLCGLAATAVRPGKGRVADLRQCADQFACRRGIWKGFPSLMLYGADWVGDNRARGNVRELTEDFSTQYRTKSLDAVTRHRGDYPALADSATFAGQKMVEMGFRSHKIPHLKRESVDNSAVKEEMRDGDIVMLLGNDPDYDVVTVGVVVRREDGFHLIHLSKEKGKVVEEEMPLGRYLKRSAGSAGRVYGWRWLRMKVL